MKEIIVYTADIKWLHYNELDFTEINLDDGNEREKFMEKYPYLRTSPQIFCDRRKIGGFTDLIEEDSNDLRLTTIYMRREGKD